jgi:hypothetical protein
VAQEDYDIGRRLAVVETELRSLSEEVKLNRSRWHSLSQSVSSVMLEAPEIHQNTQDIRELQSAHSRAKGAAMAISAVGSILAALVAAAISLLAHFPGH